ncbi:MAG: hypothetical protein A4E25_00049 [Methanobacterium sp. PtaB.Bin024]|nr:MAG: hypothetical protein A4E25_00049 [Methanobacterium sp. PtaB.Bin024]
MKSLENFIVKHTNAYEVYSSDSWRFEEITVLELDLNHYGFDWWAYQNIKNYPDFDWPESWYVASEENLRHPVIAIQCAMQKLKTVYSALEDIVMDVCAQNLYLDVVLGRP